MSAFFTALTAAMAHQMNQPPTTAPAADQFEWWFDYSDLLGEIADADDAGPDPSRRARAMAHEAVGEACRIAREAVA